MLALKFLLPGRLTRQNLTRIQSCLFASQGKQECKSVLKKPSSLSREFKTIHCGSLQEALTKCSKACDDEWCNAVGEKDEKNPKAAKHAGETYRDAYSQVKNEAWKLRLMVVNHSEDVISTIKKSDASHFEAAAARIEPLLKRVITITDSILKMNNVCGQKKRNESLRLCDSVYTRLYLYKCENKTGMNDIVSRLSLLENKVMERTEIAVGLVRTCRGCVTPHSMYLETTLAQKQATCILKEIEKYFKEQMESIDKTKADMITENNNFLNRLVKKLEQEISVFTKQLKSVARALPKSMKTCR